MEQSLVLVSSKSFSDVLGICRSFQVPNVHDESLVSQPQLEAALKESRLKMTVRGYGERKGNRYWPSAFTVACGALLVISFLKPVYLPLQWSALGAVVVGLPPILLRSIAAIRKTMLDVNILVLISVGGSIALKDYWEAAANVFLFSMAEWLESRASYKAASLMSALMSTTPQRAELGETGNWVNVADVEILSLSSINLYAAGFLTGRTTASTENSAVSKMAKLLEEAEKNRSERIIDSCAKYYTRAVVLAAVLAAVIPTAIRADDAKYWLRMSLILLVSASPSALALPTPGFIFRALAQAAETVVSVKDGDILKVVDFRVIGEQPPCVKSLLFWVSSIGCKSSDPMAAAILDHARSNGIEPKPELVKGFQIYRGEGVYGEIDGQNIFIGSYRIAARAGCGAVIEFNIEADVRTVVYVVSGTSLVAEFSLSGSCRSGDAEAMATVECDDSQKETLFGDDLAAAVYAEDEMGRNFHQLDAELTPEEEVGTTDAV